ncbi:MAG: PadR family transcriptional regulator [Rhodoferax sp.]|nr:PadR family transcriptional regulator [Rhodoferax sp.]
MSLAHAVLTSLLEKPSSGYELARRFDKSIGYFWHATHQQIYRELARMEVKGWIASDSAPDAGATRKRLYQIQPQGREELARWTHEPAAVTELRDELTVKLRALAALGEGDLREELHRRIRHHTQRLSDYAAMEARDFLSREPLSASSRLQHLILQKGIFFEKASLQWAENALALLTQR